MNDEDLVAAEISYGEGLRTRSYIGLGEKFISVLMGSAGEYKNVELFSDSGNFDCRSK